MKKDSLSNLIDFCRENNRIVPCPTKWNKLWEMLPNRERKGAGWEPTVPLILGAWWHSTEQEKQNRFISHIAFAEKKGILDKVSEFLRNLQETEWCHSGEAGGISLEDYYYSNEVFNPKEKPSFNIINNSLTILQNNWIEIAGELIAKATEPNNFSGKKARRLNVKVLNEHIKPNWGSWWSLENSDNPKSFTDFREKINENIYPHSIDHINFYKIGKRSK